MLDLETRIRSAQNKVDTLNAIALPAEDYDCPKCKNRQVIYYAHQEPAYAGGFYARDCDCKPIRDNIRHLKRMGLYQAVTAAKIEDFETKEPHQQAMVQAAKGYLEAPEGQWLFFGGQPGCGKTLLCSWLYGKLLGRGKRCYYMTWPEESRLLRQTALNPEEQEQRLEPMRTAEVLYIDDFLRGRNPTASELNYAFQLIDRRYREHRATILSSELQINEIDRLDAAIASRIVQCSGDFMLNIAPDSGRNYRYRSTYKSL